MLGARNGLDMGLNSSLYTLQISQHFTRPRKDFGRETRFTTENAQVCHACNARGRIYYVEATELTLGVVCRCSQTSGPTKRAPRHL